MMYLLLVKDFGLVKYSTSIEDNITIKLYMREFKCKSCLHQFKEKNSFSNAKERISITKEYKILEALKLIKLTFTDIASQFNVSLTYVAYLFNKKADVSRLSISEVICGDEVYFNILIVSNLHIKNFSQQTIQ